MIQFINRRPLHLYRTGDGLERPCAAMADKDFMASGVHLVVQNPKLSGSALVFSARVGAFGQQ
jgi:hypothetical protein